MTDSITKEVGFDIAGLPGMREAEVQTPCLIIDLDHPRRGMIQVPRKSLTDLQLVQSAD